MKLAAMTNMYYKLKSFFSIRLQDSSLSKFHSYKTSATDSRIRHYLRRTTEYRKHKLHVWQEFFPA